MQAFPRDKPDARPDRTPDPGLPRFWFLAKRYGWGRGLPVERHRPAPRRPVPSGPVIGHQPPAGYTQARSGDSG
jgi:hypothetical protein